MSSRALDILLASKDRSLLRHLSCLLTEFGYKVVACADFDAAQQALAAASFDFLLVEDTTLSDNFQQIAQMKQASEAKHLHVMLFSDDHDNIDVVAAFENGIDDFLRKPISAGEVLARLRAGARYCEFERRFRQQRWEDPVTGLWSKQAIIDRLGVELKKSGKGRNLAVVMLDLDLFARVNALYGQATGDTVLREVANVLQEHGLPGQFVARLDDDCFAIMLPDHSVEKAMKFGEKLRSAVLNLELAEIAPTLRLTASVGVAGAYAEQETPENLLDRGRQAVDDAKQSGRNCAACYGQFDEERRLWKQTISSGNPFESCIARDVMTPFSLVLRGTDTIAFADALFAQTHLDVLPVLDIHARFVGIVEREKVRESAKSKNRAAQPVDQVTTKGIPTLSDQTKFELVIEQFIHDDQSLLVVTKGQRPLGFIARERFLALVKPVEAEFFTAEGGYSSGTDYLVVPDLVEVE
ncbi:MAG TPA: diguanylate cyclase [Pirellulaceae bacterium]|nr:diguanylate cyclase [Pirellulaceae bacterium]